MSIGFLAPGWESQQPSKASNSNDEADKHTRGHWHVFDNRKCKGFRRDDVAVIGVTAPTADVAYFYAMDSDRTDEEVLANAHLVAAAPKMFDYLKLMASSGDQHAANIVASIRKGKPA